MYIMPFTNLAFPSFSIVGGLQLKDLKVQPVIFFSSDPNLECCYTALSSVSLALCKSLGTSVKWLNLLLTWGHFPSNVTEQADQFAQLG